MNNVGTWIALLAALGGLATGAYNLFTIRTQRRKMTAEGTKTEADAARILSATAVSLLAPARQQIASLEKRVKQLESTVVALTDRLALAQRLLTENGVPFPPVPDQEVIK